MNKICFINSFKMAKNKKETSPVSDFLYTIIGSTPVLIIVAICSFLFYNDYVLNNNSFWGKSRFVGNIESNEYFEKLACPDNLYDNDRKNYNKCAPKFCARSFSDFLITEDEAKTLLK